MTDEELGMTDEDGPSVATLCTLRYALYPGKDMFVLQKELANEIIAHCRDEFPNEACGILAGKDGKAQRVFRMTNVDKSPSSYFMDAKEQLKVMKDMRNLDLDMVGIYHSHPETLAEPSGHDVRMAFYPDVSYLIVSLKENEKPVVRSFIIKDSTITEEELKIEL